MKVKNTSMDITQLIRDMGRIRDFLASVPEDHRWTVEQLSDIEELRHVSIRMTAEAEAILEEKTNG